MLSFAKRKTTVQLSTTKRLPKKPQNFALEYLQEQSKAWAESFAQTKEKLKIHRQQMAKLRTAYDTEMTRTKMLLNRELDASDSNLHPSLHFYWKPSFRVLTAKFKAEKQALNIQIQQLNTSMCTMRDMFLKSKQRCSDPVMLNMCGIFPLEIVTLLMAYNSAEICEICFVYAPKGGICENAKGHRYLLFDSKLTFSCPTAVPRQHWGGDLFDDPCIWTLPQVQSRWNDLLAFVVRKPLAYCALYHTSKKLEHIPSNPSEPFTVILAKKQNVLTLYSDKSQAPLLTVQ